MSSAESFGSRVARCSAAFQLSERTSRPPLPYASTDARLVGAHAAVDAVFGCAQYSRQRAETRATKRTRHSCARGIGIHACAEHFVFCRHVDGRAAHSNTPTPSARASKRKGKRRSSHATRCRRCEHILSCRKRRCETWGAALQRWLEQRDLVPVAVEPLLQWRRTGISTRVDILCVRDGDVEGASARDRVVVVSLKTLGANGRMPSRSNASTSRVRMPTGFPERPDGEHTRHQLQLLIECLALADEYGVIPHDAYVVYIRDCSDAATGAEHSLAGAYRAEDWWFRTLLRDSKACESRACMIDFIIRELRK